MIGGDSIEYELLEKCCKLIKQDNPFTCEIGVRLGMGSEVILQTLKQKNHWHIGIDPYGDIDYDHFDKDSEIKFEGTYTNVALFEFTGKRVPNYIVRKVFSGAPLDGYGVIPLYRDILPFPMPMAQGGFVNQEYWPMLMERVGL